DRDPGLLLRAPPRPGDRRLPHVPLRARGGAEAPDRLHSHGAGRNGDPHRADLREGQRGPGGDARVHPRQPPARLPRLRQGRRVPAPGPDVPLGPREHPDDLRQLTLEKPIPISPTIALDRERCILCYRCTRCSETVAEDGQLVAINRGSQSVIATFEDEPYRAAFSGNVIELCPVGALTSTQYRFEARPWEIQNVPTVCGH